jgi:hypothetical protein
MSLNYYLTASRRYGNCYLNIEYDFLLQKTKLSSNTIEREPGRQRSLIL